MAPTTRFPAAAEQTRNQPVLLSSARRAFVLTILLATSSVLQVHAQFFDASQAGGPVTITAPWRFHTGDNPQWASPDFDDSQWSLLRMDKLWNVQGYLGYSGYGWYRLRLQLPANEGPLALGYLSAGLAAEIYADGNLIGVVGQMRPAPKLRRTLPNIAIIPLPATLNGRTIQLAIRLWEPPALTDYKGAISLPLPVLATEQAIRALHNMTIQQSLFALLPAAFLVVVALVIGQISFGLFFLRPRATEYAWAGLYLFGQALLWGFALYGPTHELVTQDFEIVIESIQTGVWLCWLFLIWGFMRAKADWVLRAGILLALTPPLYTWLPTPGLITITTWFAIHAVVVLSIGLLVFVRLLHEVWRGNRDAQIFLVPFLLYSVMDTVKAIIGALDWRGLYRQQSALGGLELYRGTYFTVTWDQVGFLLTYLAIGAVLVRRFTRSAEQEQRLAAEMESARQVQAQLVPLDFPRLSGFHIDAAYLPAAEVGGDFYQVFEQSDGSVVIVIGDVCGKGLKAAMTGVLAIGVARTLASEQLHPGRLLTRFNRELVGLQNGGFITCIGARIARDGTTAFANAGHLPPYRNGEEIEVQSSLPLGITPDVEYAETSVLLSPGDSLTFLSDGVVEARSKADGFFGFDRMREISRQPARTIANAAQQFGQEDDITVLKLLFTPAEIALA